MPASQDSGVTLTRSCRRSLAALFSSTRIGPQAARTVATASRSASMLVRSAWTNVGGMRRVGEAGDEGGARIPIEVHEADPRALRDEVLDERRADAGGAAGDQHRALGEAGVAGER